jgi:hypothetical protein
MTYKCLVFRVALLFLVFHCVHTHAVHALETYTARLLGLRSTCRASSKLAVVAAASLRLTQKELRLCVI